MDKPANLVFSDEATFTFLRGEILIPFGVITSVLIAALITIRPPLNELALPFFSMIGAWLAWVGLFVLIAWGYRLGEKRAINRLFSGEIWECWQFPSSVWQAQVDRHCNLISPKDEGIKAYLGAVYSSIIGLIFSIIMIVVGFFAVNDPLVKTALWVGAGIVFLLFLGAGLFQPLFAKYKADRYRRKALQITEPRVWFGSEGVYHEALGHTSLKDLHKVTDQTKSRQAIQFTLMVSSDTYDDLVKTAFPVPHGYEDRASRLVLRYRAERLQS